MNAKRMSRVSFLLYSAGGKASGWFAPIWTPHRNVCTGLFFHCYYEAFALLDFFPLLYADKCPSPHWTLRLQTPGLRLLYYQYICSRDLGTSNSDRDYSLADSSLSIKHWWFSGKIGRCHRPAPGSIPGRCIFSSPIHMRRIFFL